MENMIKKNAIFGLLLVVTVTVAMFFGVSAKREDKLSNDNDLFVGTQSKAAKVVISFHNALKHGDKNAARALLADDVVIYEGGNIERSAEEYASHHLMADIKYLATVESELLEHQVFSAKNLAYSIARSQVKGNYNGKEIDNIGMESITLKNTKSGWKITHIHWSN